MSNRALGDKALVKLLRKMTTQLVDGVMFVCYAPLRCGNVKLTADGYGVTQDLPVGTDESVWAEVVGIDSVAGSWTSEGPETVSAVVAWVGAQTGAL